MNLVLNYDQNPNSLPTGFVTAMNYVVSYFDNLFKANVTVTINVGFGEIDGQRLDRGALGESEQVSVSPVSYTSVRNALIAQNAPGASTLPAMLPAGVPGVLYMPSAEQKALGFIADNQSVDGYIGFSSSSNIFSYGISTTPRPGQYYFVGVAEHEITEILGRVSYLGYSGAYSLMDLFRYSGPGVRQFTTGDPSYFSIDGGATNLNNWNNYQSGNTGDLGDWAPSAGNDAFDDNSNPGVVNSVSSADLINMAALGWAQTSSSQPTQPSPPSQPGPPTTGLEFVGVGSFAAGPSAALAWQIGGGIEIWANNGGFRASLVANAHMGSPWVPAGLVDFHNGRDAILWDNGTGGQLAVWQLSGSTLTGAAIPSGAMGAEWSVVGAGDFAGNGNADALWLDANTGQVAAWYLSGTSLSSFGMLGQTVSAGSAVVATGDFFQTGRDAVLWESAGGQLQSWLLNGVAVQAAVNVGQIGRAWHVAGVGAFAGISAGGVGNDIVWVDTSNNVQIWHMSNGQITRFVTPNGHDGTEWQLQGVGDFTNSGSSQLLWLDGKGNAQIWRIDGVQVSVLSTTAPAGTAALASGDITTPSFSGNLKPVSFGEVEDLQYVTTGQTIANPVIDDGMLQLASGAVVEGPITFSPGSAGILYDGDQAALPDTVVGFNEGSTHLRFAGDSPESEAQVIASAQTVDGNTLLTFPDHTSIVLVGITHVDTGIFG